MLQVTLCTVIGAIGARCKGQSVKSHRENGGTLGMVPSCLTPKEPFKRGYTQ